MAIGEIGCKNRVWTWTAISWELSILCCYTPIPCCYTLPVTAHPGALSQQLLRRSWPHYHRTARFHDARLLVSDLFDCIPCRRS